MRIGFVSSINIKTLKVRVTFKDNGQETSLELPVIKNGTDWLPKIGQIVICLFRENGEGDGVIIGSL